MSALGFSLLAVFIVSAASLIGVSTLFFSRKTLGKITSVLIALAAGSLLGASFFDLLPEALELSAPAQVLSYVLVGIVAFFIIEKLLFWYHCHNGVCEGHTFTTMNLLGDGLHNLIDGMIITTSFFVDTSLGLISSVAILLHELPQEIGDFFILLYGGFSRSKALFYNLLSALTAFLGVFLAFFFYTKTEAFTSFLIPFAAGGFIYIATADLIPELHKEPKFRKTFIQLILFLTGILLIRQLTLIL